MVKGHDHAADNRKTLNNTGWTVANFRVASTGMSEFLFDEFNNVYVVVADLAMFGADQWAVLAKADLAGSPPDIGLGFSFYHPGYGDLALHIVRDDAWLSYSWEGLWVGSGSHFGLTTSALYMGLHLLWATPPNDAHASINDPTLRQ